MIVAISDGGSTPGLMNYLVGPGRSNEHDNPHLVAGSSVVMRRWGSWDELSPAQAYEIARRVDQFMTETGTRPTGSRRVFNQDTGRRETVRDDAPNHVWHCSLSLHPDEGVLTDEAWRRVVSDFMDAMGFTGADGKAECMWVAVNHGTATNGGDHVHVVANTVREDGTKWDRWHDQTRAGRACNMIEHRYGLRVVEAREHARGARADSAADLRASRRQGRRRTNREVLEERVRAAAVASTSEVDFLVRLRELGVRARPRFAQGRDDVVTGYRVGLHARAGERTQWYGGGRLARDLTLPRLRARWPDTPWSAQQAVDAWRQAWRGMPPHHVSSRAELAARVRALDTWGRALRSTDPADPVALADAARDVAGLLSAHALAAREPSAARLLALAARGAGRACQTHRRPGRASEVPQAVSLAASLALSAAVGRGADPAVLVVQSLALVEALADLYQACQQARTAADMLEASRAALEAVTTPAAARELEALRAEAAWQALAGTAGPVQEGGHPAPGTGGAAGGRLPGQDGLAQVRAVMARAMPAGTVPLPDPAGAAQGGREPRAGGSVPTTAASASQVPSTVRAAYLQALPAARPIRPGQQRDADPPPPARQQPASGRRRTR